MTRPTRSGVALLAAGLPIALLPSLAGSGLWVAWVVYDALALLLFGLDWLLALSPDRIEADVSAPPILHLGRPGSVRVGLHTRDWHGNTEVRVACDVVGEGTSSPGSVQLAGAMPAILELSLVAHRRGTLRLTALWLRWTGPLGLLQHTRSVSQTAETAVVPDIQAVRAAALRLATTREFLVGIKTRRYVGDGSEFESLREYQPGLDHRAIDWKASAHHWKLLCREYRAERNDRIILAFDTGRLMSEPVDGMPRLDHAINSGLLLAYLSLRLGDRVGLAGFDERLRAYLEPQAGVQAIQRLLQHSARLEYHPTETNFTLALAELSGRLRRRAIVVVLTEFEDSVTAELMIENLDRLARRHLTVFVAIRDPMLQRLPDTPPKSLVDVNRCVIVSEMAQDREVVLRRLQRSGVWCLDAEPRRISVDLINRYLEIKRRRLV